MTSWLAVALAARLALGPTPPVDRAVAAPVAPHATARTASQDGPRGVATWYGALGIVGAAGPALRAFLGPGWRGDRVTVCAGPRCVRVLLVDWCACGPRGGRPTLVDLSPAAFRRLAPLSAGVVPVEASR